MKEQIEKIIKDALKNLGIEAENVLLERPAELAHGDYATNVALAYAKEAGTNPRELAEKIVAEISQVPSTWEKVEIAGPGFINFFLKKEFFEGEISRIVSMGDHYGKSEIHKGKLILVEHSSPNLFKPFHVGHVMNNAIGESISRLSKFSGAKTISISFPSDISLGIAKAIFIILEKHSGEEDFVPDNIVMLGDAYVEGTKRYDEDESIHARVKEIADNLFAEKDSPEFRVFSVCKKFNMDYFINIARGLGSEFDGYIYESEAGVKGKEIVLANTPGVFTKSEGAIVYVPEESKKHINTAVFINSQGNPTYEAKDLGLLDLKFERYNPDLSIFITDHEQISHFNVVLDAVEKINNDFVLKSVHRTHGRMTFKGQKMSSRLGGVPLAKDLLDTLHEDVEKKSPELDQESKEKIAISALKFSILRAMAGKNIDFDPETSLSFEGDSGPYLQYTAVRAESVLQKAGKNMEEKLKNNNEEISDIEKRLVRFHEVVGNSISSWAPHYIATYLCELAQTFNSWYAHTQIIDENNPNMNYNLAITKATAQVIRNGLWLLGIETPEKM